MAALELDVVSTAPQPTGHLEVMGSAARVPAALPALSLSSAHLRASISCPLPLFLPFRFSKLLRTTAECASVHIALAKHTFSRLWLCTDYIHTICVLMHARRVVTSISFYHLFFHPWPSPPFPPFPLAFLVFL